MSGRRGSVVTTGTTPAVSVEECALQILAAAGRPVSLLEIAFHGRGEDNTDQPVLVKIRRQSNAGTGGGAVVAEKADDGLTYAFVTTAQEDVDGGMPTAVGDPLRVYTVHPQTGLVVRFDSGEIMCDGGNRLGLTIEYGADVSPYAAHMVFEE